MEAYKESQGGRRKTAPRVGAQFAARRQLTLPMTLVWSRSSEEAL